MLIVAMSVHPADHFAHDFAILLGRLRSLSSHRERQRSIIVRCFQAMSLEQGVEIVYDASFLRRLNRQLDKEPERRTGRAH